MKKSTLSLFILFLSFEFFAQMNHELKIPFHYLRQGIITSSYELIGPNNKFGLELGGGTRFQSAYVRTPDILNDVTKHKKRTLFSSAFLKYYIRIEDNSKGPLHIYVGPMIEYNRVNFLEESYFT